MTNFTRSLRTVALVAAGSLSLLVASPALAGGECSGTAKAAKRGPTIVDAAKRAGTFDTLLAALTTAELAAVLDGDGPFTVFAPTDDAFARLGKKNVARLLEPQNREQLVRILKNHVVSGRVLAADAVAARSAHTLASTALDFSIDRRGQLTVADARIVRPDLQTSNGVIHVVDRVLVP